METGVEFHESGHLWPLTAFRIKLGEGVTMDDRVKERIVREIEDRFYYIEYPRNVPKHLWKDGAGKFHGMDTMELGHLKASIRLVQKDRKAFIDAIESYKGDLNGHEAAKALLPLVDEKLQELQEVFKRKVEED